MAYDMGTATGHVDLDVSGFTSAVQNMSNSVDRLNDTINDQGNAGDDAAKKQAAAFALAAKAVNEVVEAVKSATKYMVELGQQVVNIGADFETAMAQVAATTGMSANDVARNISDYQDLTEAAKEAGLSTMYSASEAAEALNYLALAGYSVEESIEYMPQSLTLAAAGAMDLGRASDMVTDAISALGLEMEDTQMFIDKMAKTAQSSNTNIQQLGSAILTIGGTAQILEGGVTELDTALGILANNGIKAAQGGTALRQILVNLSKPTSKAKDIIEDLGLKIYDAEGNMRHLNEIFGDLNEIMKDFSDAERMDVLTNLFDARQLRAANALLKDSGDKWDELQAKIEDAEGSAEKMAETMRSNLNGSLNILKSNLDSLAITIYEGVQKNITDLVNEAIPKLKELNEVLASPEVQSRLESMSAQIKEIALKLLDVAIDAAPKLLNMISNIEANLKSLAIVIGTILAFKLATHITDILTSLMTLAQFLATNPYTIAAAALAAIAVAFIQIKESSDAAYAAMVASAQEANDVYAEQRKEIEGVVDEWNDYKETATQVTDEAHEQADKVKALYEEYKRLYEAGEDTTLAMEALADEIPELKTMLADGKGSFEDITTAVNDYCNSLIRAAEIEATKDTYVQAIKTRNEIKRSLDAQKQAMIESGEAAVKAREAYEDYWNNFDTHYAEDAKIANEELERLRAEKEAKEEIYAENIATYSKSVTAYNEANQAVLDSQADYNEAIKNELLEEGQIYEDATSARQATAKKQAEQYAEESKARAQQLENESQAEVDKVIGAWDKLDKAVSRREITEDDKWRIVGDWFEANPNWDKDNDDLIKQYDKYMSYEEKKEDELKKQEEQEAKDREKQKDKIAAEAKKKQQEREKKAKEEEQRITKEVSADLSTIDYEKDLYEWDGETYLKALKDHLDKYADYYESHAEEKLKIDRKVETQEKANRDKAVEDEEKRQKDLVKADLDNIEWERKYHDQSLEEYNNALKEHLKKYAKYYQEHLDERKELIQKIKLNDKDITKQQAEQAKKDAEAYFKTWSSGYESLLKEAQSAYNELQSKRENFQNNLLKSVELYGTKTKQVWDKATHQYKEEKIEGIVSTKDLKEQLKDLNEFDRVMKSLKSRGVSDNLLSKIWSMDSEKAMEFAKALNKMSSGELQNFSQTYENIYKKTSDMSNEYYQEELKKFTEEYIDPLQQYVKDNADELKQYMGNIGEDTITGWITGMESKYSDAEGTLGSIMTDGIKTAKEALGISSPSKEFFKIGEFTIQGFLDGIQSKIDSISTIFTSLGQKAGESFINSFKATWDNFINLLNTTGGLSVPTAMTTTMFGSPMVAGSQVMYNNNTSSYTGLTREDVVSAIKEAVPDGDVILTVNESQFGRISRSSLNLLAEQQGTLGLQV